MLDNIIKCLWKQSYDNDGSTFYELKQPELKYKMTDHPLYDCTNCSGTIYSKYNNKYDCYTRIKTYLKKDSIDKKEMV